MDHVFLVPIVASIVAGCFAAASAWNVERLKTKLEREKVERSELMQRQLATLSFEMDKLRKTYDIHIKKEYELYEMIFQKIYAAYTSFQAAQPIDAPLLTIEQIDVDASKTTCKKIEEKRRERFGLNRHFNS